MRTCQRECCYQKEKCLHSPDPVFRPECGLERVGGFACEKHPQFEPPPPTTIEEKPAHQFDWVGTAERAPTKLDFKSTYENDVRVLCAVVMSNTFVRLGLDPLDLSEWARDRFQELTAVGWKAPKDDIKNTLIQLGYLPEETS